MSDFSAESHQQPPIPSKPPQHEAGNPGDKLIQQIKKHLSTPGLPTVNVPNEISELPDQTVLAVVKNDQESIVAGLYTKHSPIATEKDIIGVVINDRNLQQGIKLTFIKESD